MLLAPTELLSSGNLYYHSFMSLPCPAFLICFSYVAVALIPILCWSFKDTIFGDDNASETLRKLANGPKKCYNLARIRYKQVFLLYKSTRREKYNAKQWGYPKG